MADELKLYAVVYTRPTGGTAIHSPDGWVEHLKRTEVLHSVGKNEEEVKANLNLPRDHKINSVQEVTVDSYTISLEKRVNS